MKIMLLDGGVGQELVRRSGDRATPLWSTRVMIDHPDLVAELHRDYARAGARIMTANTYAVLPDRLDRMGAGESGDVLRRAALDAARSARNEFPGTLVAGSLGPLRASYRPDLCPPPERAAEEYGEVVPILLELSDLILVETMSSVGMADGALRATLGRGLPVWLGVSVSDDGGGRLRSGEHVSELEPLLSERRPDAVLVNCSVPEAVAPALEIIRGFGLPFGAYDNGFTRIGAGFLEEAPTVDALTRRDDLTPERYADFVVDWVDLGARIVGGCCEVSPAHIEEVANRLRREGHDLADGGEFPAARAGGAA